jgi:hypothetical protein
VVLLARATIAVPISLAGRITGSHSFGLAAGLREL